MSDPNYEAIKAKCSANFDQFCINYFLSLPKSDLFTSNQSRGNFAGAYCSDMSRMGQVPCSLVCRDGEEVCLKARMKYCASATLESVENGSRPECACYLPQSEYKRHIERLRLKLGDAVANQLELSINDPHCFYAPCARSAPGLDTRLGGCQALTGCIQSIEYDNGGETQFVATNICNINNSVIPPNNPAFPPGPVVMPPSSTTFSSLWIWVLVFSVVIIIVLIIFIVYFYKKKKESEMLKSQRNLLLLS